MKWNEGESVAFLASRIPDWQGLLSYKPPRQGGTFALQQSVFKERYFKLVGNLLFCLRSEGGEVISLLVLETCSVQKEDKDQNLFSISFAAEDSGGGGGVEKHIFAAETKQGVIQWIEALQCASYEKKREELILLQIKLRSLIGKDPLEGTAFANSQVYSLRNRDEEAVEAAEAAPSRSPGRRTCKVHNKNGAARSNFTSHLGIQVWERREDEEHVCDESCHTVAQPTPSFKSHVQVTTNLIEF